MASEVLKRATIRAMTDSENTLLTAAAGHTYTVLNISLCETAAAAETFDLYVRDDAGANDFYIYKAQALAANATFEHTTRLTLEATDVLSGITASSADVDVVITYLDQTL
jgi:isopentenyl diphosphate isomerase/L-lactate dehydrogenase-like FMN-dependent dehydrogenase